MREYLIFLRAVNDILSELEERNWNHPDIASHRPEKKDGQRVSHYVHSIERSFEFQFYEPVVVPLPIKVVPMRIAVHQSQIFFTQSPAGAILTLYTGTDEEWKRDRDVFLKDQFHYGETGLVPADRILDYDAVFHGNVIRYFRRVTSSAVMIRDARVIFNNQSSWLIKNVLNDLRRDRLIRERAKWRHQ